MRSLTACLGVSRLNLVGGCFWLFVIVDVLGHLPHLHDVVFRHRADDPGLVGIPREVGDLCCVSAVDEQELWWAVFGIFRSLFFSDLRQVPDVEAAVGSAAGQDGLVMRRPLNLEDFVLVRLKGMQFEFQVTQVPQSDSLISRSSCQDEFWKRI